MRLMSFARIKKVKKAFYENLLFDGMFHREIRGAKINFVVLRFLTILNYF